MLEIQNLRFHYHAAEKVTFNGLDCTIDQGIFLAIVGSSGSGKSTLLRTLNGLIPHFHGGRFGGNVVINGSNTRDVSTADLSRMVGFVGQEPEAQTVFDTVADEIAFGPENLGLDTEEIGHRVDTALQTLNIADLRDRDISTLSGGERQRVVIAATLAMGSRLLVLDEPLSQLDPWAGNDLLETLTTINREQGVTIIIAEHRIDRVLPHCTHVLELPAKSAEGTLQPVSQAMPELITKPTLVHLAQRLGWPSLPLTINEARDIYSRTGPKLATSSLTQPDPGPMFLKAENVTVERGDRALVEDVSLDVQTGSVVALMGANGSGKTTLLRALAGFQKLSNGLIEITGKPLDSIPESERAEYIGYVPQYPAALFLGLTVREEINLTFKSNDASGNTDATLEYFALAHLAHHNSFDISGGERQRLALAIATARRPPLLLLDEPTRGMDHRATEQLKRLLADLSESGVSIVLATHDSDLTAACADQVVLLQSGQVVATGSPAEIFTHEPVLMTDVGRVLGSDFLTLEDVDQSLRHRSTTPVAPQHLATTTPD